MSNEDSRGDVAPTSCELRQSSDIKKAEEQPRSVAQLQATLNVIPAHTWYTAPSGGLTFVNKRTADYLGLPKDHPLRFGIDIGAPWDAYIQFLHPDEREESRKFWSTCLRTGEAAEFSQRVRNAQGGYRWFLSRAEPLRADDGTLLQWVGVNLDIEELKYAEQALRESERKLRQLIESVPCHFWSVNPDGEPTYVNQRLLDYFGIRRLEVQKPIDRYAVLHPDDVPETERVLNHAFQTGVSFQRVHRLRRADGVYRWHRVRAEPLRDHKGDIIQWYGFSIDIDEGKKAEDALRESEKSLRSAIDGIAGLVLILAANGEIETVNRQVLDYFGRSVEELKNWGTSDAVHPEDLPRVLELLKRSIATGTHLNYELRMRRFDGKYRWFENRGVPIRDETGRIVRWYVLLVDIEDRTRALERLQQMQSDFAHMNRVSMMGEMAASLSHEITQPIASARNNARAALNFLGQQAPDLDEVREALSSVVSAADRSGEIIERIRDHIKKAPPRKAYIDLNHAIDEVIVLARSAIIKNRVSVQTRLAEDLPPVQGDHVQLQQVIMNLILNAVQAMDSVVPGLRELLISTEWNQAKGVLVAVRDTGPGIEPKNLERVFESFYTTKSAGTGMGLSICRSIVEAHSGRLWASANSPRGAIFQFTLPNARQSSVKSPSF
jgi:PAS domain S-box-containing protein